MKQNKTKRCGTTRTAKATKKAPSAKKTSAKQRKTDKTVAAAKTRSASTSARRAPAKQPKKDIFTGATEVAITDNKIIVTRQKSKNVQGKYEKREVREYHDKTPSNMTALNRKLTAAEPKKVSVKFK